MSEIVVKDFLEAGIHYGHRTSRWNPKMRPYIYGRRNLIHIIDIKETIRGLLRAKKYLNKVASQGSLILFCGTKKQAAETIRDCATSVNMPYVDYRWLGGIFTNFRTMRTRMKRLEELDQIFSSGDINTYSKKMQSKLSDFKLNVQLYWFAQLTRISAYLKPLTERQSPNAMSK